ncbi:MAG TPA: DUF5317 family protein [Actinomycetota bacterium]|nr:DUF5317 family protein [Actinomycetota bacterium]
MLLILAAIVAGIAIGYALRGSLRNLARLQFRWWGLAFLAAALQLAPTPSSPDLRWVGAALLMASYAAVVAFVALNIRLPGIWLIAVGFAVNLLAIGFNGGMPVSDAALRQAYGIGYAEQRQQLLSGHDTKHHLERSDDVLRPLTDVIPVDGVIHQVLSVGDLVWLVGVVWLVAGSMRRTPV